jgi:hypothetical protein
MKFGCKVKEGRVTEGVSKEIRACILHNEGKHIEIEIKRKSNVTQAQYGYLYAVIYPRIKVYINDLHQENYIENDIDIMMKLKFWYDSIIDIDTGEVTKIPKYKHKMNKEEMSKYIDNIIKWCLEFLNLDIPQPVEGYDYEYSMSYD